MATDTQKYNSLKYLSYDLNVILLYTSDLIDTLDKVPDVISLDGVRDSYDDNFLRYSVEYARKRKKLIRKVNDYLDVDEDSLVYFSRAIKFSSYLKSIPDKYSDAVYSKDVIIGSLTAYRNDGRKAKRNMIEKMNTLVGGSATRDIRSKVLSRIVINALDNPATTSTVLDKDVTPETTKEVLEVKFNKTRQEIKNITSELDAKLSLGSLADLEVNRESSLFKRMLKKLGQLNRGISKNTGGVGQSMESYWRERIRKRYGRSLPFCDEVDANGNPIMVTDANGVKRYAKATDVIDIGGGKYILKTEEAMDKIRKSLRSDEYDTY
jgi:hypothetical protein